MRKDAKIHLFVLRANHLSSSTERWRKVSALCHIICVGFADNSQAAVCLREFAKIYRSILRVNHLSSSTERWRKVSALCHIICVGFADNSQATATNQV